MPRKDQAATQLLFIWCGRRDNPRSLTLPHNCHAMPCHAKIKYGINLDISSIQRGVFPWPMEIPHTRKPSDWGNGWQLTGYFKAMFKGGAPGCRHSFNPPRMSAFESVDEKSFQEKNLRQTTLEQGNLNRPKRLTSCSGP